MARPKKDTAMPYREEDTLKELYLEQKKTLEEIGEKFGVSTSTIQYWCNQHNIERRDRDYYSGWDSPRWNHYAGFMTTKNGYELWQSNIEGKRSAVKVHRLLAVAEYGFDAVKDMNVHHRSHIPWDNRPEAIELLDHDEHSKMHQTARVRRERPRY